MRRRVCGPSIHPLPRGVFSQCRSGLAARSLSPPPHRAPVLEVFLARAHRERQVIGMEQSVKVPPYRPRRRGSPYHRNRNVRCHVSDRGVVEQTILVWDEPHHLAFSMDRCELYFRSCVPSIVDDFDLVPKAARRHAGDSNDQRDGARRWFRWAKGTAPRWAVKRIHRFVFRQLGAAGDGICRVG